MAIQSKLELRKYQYGIDIRKTHHIYGKDDKRISFGEWLRQRTDQCIIVEMITNIGKREAFFYQELNGHDHIIRTFGSIENDLNQIIYVQEYAQQRDLAGLLFDTPLSQLVLIEMFRQISDAMSYVASKSIVHGDLGCRNILIFKLDPVEPKNNLVKITDFGLARSLNGSSAFGNSSIIPQRYCALEILRNNHQSSYTEKSDVYSMGVLMWEALSNSEIPYSYIADDNLVAQIKLDERLKRPPGRDHQLWTLIENCWENDREWRPTFEQIKYVLSAIRPSEVPDVQKPILYEPPTGYKFKLNVDVTRNGLLGGRFREIYEARWISREEKPIVLIELDNAPTKDEILFHGELVKHRHIIHTLGFVENNLGKMMLLQERAPHGHLQELLKNNQFEPSATVLIAIFLQIIDAMMYVVSQGMIHGDLRCSNVLVFEMDPSKPKENFVKLTNFALARPNNPSLLDDRRLTIPVKYCAPEILRSAGRLNYCELSDVYSMGVLMWEACSQGKLPYDSSISNKEVREKKLNGEILPRPWTCDRQIWPIIKNCWNNEPQSRSDFKSMKTQLSTINLESQFQYELGVDVKMGDRLHGRHGQIFYNAEWICKNKSPVILIALNTRTAEREASFYIELSSHQHIVHTFGLVKNDPRSTMLIQERAPHGNLLTLLQSKRFKPSAKILVVIFSQIVDAMIYIADQDIIHGNLCCANVLVFQMSISEPRENLVKLTNFALTCTNDPSFINDRQTPSSIRYSAPEIVKSTGQSTYSELSDVYSMGVLMWEACSQGGVPYGDDTNDNNIRRRKLSGEKLPEPQECDIRIWQIIEDCWYDEPQFRYNFKDMMKRLSVINVIDHIDVTYHVGYYEQHLDNEIINDKRSHSPEPATAIPPKRKHEQHNRQYLATEPENHPESHRSKHSVVTSEPTLRIQCRSCEEEFSWDGLDAHEQICSRTPRLPSYPSDSPSSVWERFCSWLPCFRKNK